MKTPNNFTQLITTPAARFARCLGIIALAGLLIESVSAQGTAFTYQGRLNDGANLANGNYDLTFALFDAASAGAQQGTTLTNAAIAVSNGLFTVALDFGNQFPGADRWLEIGVRANGDTNDFLILAPRQQLTATPYATRAASASAADTATSASTAATANSVNASNILGAVALAQLPSEVVTNGASGVNLTGTFSGDGGGLSNIAAAGISGVMSAAQIPNLDGSKITTGTVALSRLPANLVTNGASGVSFSGTFSGNGVGMTNVDLLNINSRGGISWGPRALGVFAFSSSPSVGSSPRSVITADVNGDGKLDLISANSGLGTLSVLTNNGSGGVVLAASPSVGGSPNSVTSADVNGDGRLDLISANSSSPTLSVLTNNGSGGFVPSASLPVGVGPVSVTAADVNGDGKPDLISANNGGSTLSVLTNNGNGNFALASSPSVGSGPVSVASADVNGDGKLDLISANVNTATLSVLTNTGSGGFVLNTTLNVGNLPRSVITADVNADGKTDLISANNGAHSVTVLTNNGSGLFGLSGSLAVGSGPWSVTAADVNEDGKPDLISANSTGNTLTVLTNNGSGGFALAGSPGVGAVPLSVAAGDLNGDGAVDLVSANFNSSTLTVLFNTTTNVVPMFLNLNASNLISGTVPDARLSANVALETSPNVFTETNRFSSVVLATNGGNQFSGNGAGLTGVDLRSVNSAGALVWATNTSVQLSSSPSVGDGPFCVVAADINGNGSRDLITANSGDNALAILNNNGSGSFALAGTVGVGVNPLSVAAVDVNGDGRVDLVGANNGGNTLTVLTNNGSGGFVLSTNLIVGNGPRSVITADVNADGKADLISANNFANTVSVMTNNGSGLFGLSGSLAVGSGPWSVAAADVNGDGKVDLTTANFNVNTLSVLTNNGSGGFVLSSSPTVGSAPRSVTAADVNGDGRPDLISANFTGGTLSVLTNNGSGGFVLMSSPAVGSGPYSVAATDMNGDGKMDLICANNGVNTLSVLTNNGTGTFTTAVTPGVGSAPVFVTAADVNADGMPDLISANSGGNTVSVLFNTAGPIASYRGSFTGNAIGLTNLDATKIVGTLASAQIPNLDASKITSGVFGVAQIPNLDASKIITGTLSDSRLSGNIPRLNANNEFTGINGLNADDLHFRNSADANHGVGWYGNAAPFKTFAGYGPDGPILYGYQAGGLGTTLSGQRLALMWNSAGNVGIGKTDPTTMLDVNGTVSALSFSGDGSGLTNLTASSFNVADSQLSPNVALLNTNQAFSGVVAMTNSNNTLAGDGSGLTGLNASQLANGTLDSARLSNNVALLNRSIQSFTGGTNSFSGNVGISTTTPAKPLQIGEINVQQDAMIRLAAGNGGANRTWTLGVPYGGSDVTGTNYDFVIADTTANATRFVVEWDTGNVGIGTNVPAQKLHVAGNVLANGTVTATSLVGSFTGNGLSLTNLNATQLTSGTVADARLTANVSLLGQTIESSEITDGTIANADLSASAAIAYSKLNLGNSIVNADINASAAIADTKLATISTAGKVANGATTATSANNPSTIVARDGSGNFTAGTVTATSFSGNGANLTSLNAASLTSGTVSDAQLAANVARTNANQTFYGVITATNVNNRFAGTIEVPYVKLTDEKGKGVNGGSSAAGLNFKSFNMEYDPQSLALIINNNTNIQLNAGTYQCVIRSPAFRANQNQARLKNLTAATVLLYGTSQYTDSADGGDTTHSIITGQFTLGSTSTLVVEHYFTSAKSTDGLGAAVNPSWTDGSPQEIYTVAEFWKIK